MDRLEILARAWTAGANVEGMDKTTAIRAIQTAEGYEPCFGRGLYAVCDQAACAFRGDCEQIPGEEESPAAPAG